MDTSASQAQADARYAELKRKGWSRDAIWEALVEDGYSLEQATAIVDGVALAELAPVPTRPDPEEVLRGALETLDGDAGTGGPIDRSDRAFWARALGGEPNARWLLQDPGVQAAIASGRPLQIHRAFARHAGIAPPGPPRDAYRRVMADRRLFFDRPATLPGLSTVQGIGARLYGAADKNPKDGTYIATRFLTFVFVPLWPLDAYLVANAGGGARYWLGHVPLSPFHRWWRRVAAIAALSAVLAIGLGAWMRGRYEYVHFLNELDVPVVVRVAGEQIDLDPHARDARRLRAGRHHLSATRPSGRVIEEADVDVAGQGAVLVYSVLGAAPLFEAWIEYRAEREAAGPAQRDASATFLGGRSWVVVPNVQFAFVEPPARLEMPGKPSVLERKALGIHCGGWRRCIEELESAGRLADAAALAQGVSLAVPESETAHAWAWSYLAAHGGEEAVSALVDQLVRIAPGGVEVQRFVQDHARAAGRAESLRPVYEALYRAAPSDRVQAYLYARLLEPRAAQGVLETALEAAPDDPLLLRALGWIHFVQAAYEEAAPIQQALLLQSDGAAEHAVNLAWSLASLGRMDAALRTLEMALDQILLTRGCPLRADLLGAVGEALALYAALGARVPGAPGATPLETYVRSFSEGDEIFSILMLLYRARARDPDGVVQASARVQGDDLARFVDLTLLSRTDVAAAAAAYRRAPGPVAPPLDDAACLAIACELYRLGEAALARDLLVDAPVARAGDFTPTDLERLPDLHGVSADLQPQLRAVVLLAAARAATDPEEAQRLRAEARRHDPQALLLPPE